MHFLAVRRSIGGSDPADGTSIKLFECRPSMQGDSCW